MPRSSWKSRRRWRRRPGVRGSRARVRGHRQELAWRSVSCVFTDTDCRGRALSAVTTSVEGLKQQIAKQRSDSGAHSIAAPRRAFSRPIRARPGVHRHLARIADVLVRETADFRRAADERSAALQTQ